MKQRRRTIENERRWGRKPRLPCSGKMLREARLHAKLGLRDVCDHIAMSPGQLSDIESGVGTTPLNRVVSLCGVLGVPQETLIAAILQDQVYGAGLAGIVVRCERVANDTAPITSLEADAEIVGVAKRG